MVTMPELDVFPQVHIDTRDNVKKLLESSLRSEKLTTRLNLRTIALIALTVVLIGVAVLRA
jgi:hypothetical protein